MNWPAATNFLPLAVITGIALGFAGALGHLQVTRWRSSLLLKGGPLAVVLTLPLALLPLAAAVLLAARVAPAAAWVSPLGILLARFLLLRRMAQPK